MGESAPGAVLRLTFTLPAALLLLARPGRHQPCLHGCRLDVAENGSVEIQGRDRLTIFRQAERFLAPLVRGCPPGVIAATLATPALQGANGEAWRGGLDSWSIVIQSRITFAPTVVPPLCFT